MAVTVDELKDSPVVGLGESPFADRRFAVKGTGDEDEAAAALLAQTDPVFYVNLQRLVRREPTLTQIAPTIWAGSVRYGASGQIRQPQPFEEIWAGSTLGGTTRIVKAYSRLHGDSPSGSGLAVPTFDLGINVANGEPQGVEVPDGPLEFQVTKYFPREFVNNRYLGLLHQMRGRVNNEFFIAFQAGECLHLGATWGLRSDLWEVTFHFAALPNEDEVEFDGFDTFSKLGWDYLWAYWERTADTSANVIGSTARAVYVDRVLKFGDLRALGIVGNAAAPVLGISGVGVGYSLA